MAVIGLLVLIMLKFVFFMEIQASILLPVLLIMPLTGRWSMVWVIYRFGYARSEGMGQFFQNSITTSGIIMVSVFCLIICFLVLPAPFYWAIPLTGACMFWMSKRINTVLSGHTGDTYGFMSELAELFFLFWCVVLSKL